jgi:hypothetical protein
MSVILFVYNESTNTYTLVCEKCLRELDRVTPAEIYGISRGGMEVWCRTCEDERARELSQLSDKVGPFSKIFYIHTEPERGELIPLAMVPHHPEFTVGALGRPLSYSYISQQARKEKGGGSGKK